MTDKFEKLNNVSKDKQGNYVSTSSVYRIKEDGSKVLVSWSKAKADSYHQALQNSSDELHEMNKELAKDNPEMARAIQSAPTKFSPLPLVVEPPPDEKPKDRDGDGIPDNVDKYPDDAAPPKELIKSRNHTLWYPDYLPKELTEDEARTAARLQSGHSRDFDGRDATGVLREPVPSFNARPGDCVITGEGISPEHVGVNNNAFIVLGRDRSGYNESAPNYKSGFSDHMAAGAIDIVVGRMAPFPLMKFKGPGADGEKKRIGVGPFYRSDWKDPNLSNQIFTGGDGENVTHSGRALDAARIYISQMSNVDNYFGLIKEIKTLGELDTAGEDIKKSQKGHPKNKDTNPTSAVVQAADQIRLYGRQGVRIITGGDEATHNSQGNKIQKKYGIHLVAGNGDFDGQEAIPKGKKLVDLLDQMLDISDATVGLLEAFADAQSFYNGFLLNHFHGSPLGGTPTTPSPTTIPTGIKTQIDHFARVRLGVIFLKTNIVRLKQGYLSISGKLYINSKYNTTN